MKSLLNVFLALFLIGCNSKPTVEEGGGGGEGGKVLTSSDQTASSAPNFTLQSITGQGVSLSDFKGKVVLLDFWATWCAPCRTATPSLVRFNQKFKGKDFALIGISLDETKSDVIPFIQQEKVEHLILYGGGTIVEQDYNIRAVPTFFLLDKSGKIVKRYSGFYPGLTDEWEKEIHLLLAKG